MPERTRCKCLLKFIRANTLGNDNNRPRVGPIGIVASNIPLAFALIFLIFTFSLDAVLSALSDLSPEPFSSMSAREYQGVSEWKMKKG